MSVFIHGIWIFYKKLIVPSAAISIVLGFIGESGLGFFPQRIGIAYIVITPLMHYATYELKNPNEYYFYYNIGLSKMVLWISTFIISFLVGQILIQT